MNTKANVKQSATTVLTLPVISGGQVVKDEKSGKEAIYTIDCGNVSGSIGKLLEDVKPGTELRIFGATVKMPTGTFTNRFNSFVKKVTELAYYGCDDNDKPKDESATAFITGLKGKIHFADLRRVSVMRGLNIRLDNYREKVKTARNATDSLKENVVLLQETSTLKDVNKAYKEGGRPAVEKLLSEKKGLKVIGWNS